MRSWVLIFTLACVRLFGQTNLVPNPSFEVYDTCPDMTGDIQNALPWFQPNAAIGFSTGSSDFYQSCSAGNVSVPSNVSGYQMPRSGLGYGGFGMFGDPNDFWGHEYMETALSSSLDSDANYCVSFYLVLADVQAVCGTSAIGAYFSTDSCLYNSSIGYPINVQPQAINDSNNVVTDTISWTLVSAIIHPSGGESFMTIGNFWGPSYNATNSDTICGSGNGGVPYFFIDDISVVKLPAIYAGVDQVITVGDSAQLVGSISETWFGMQFEWLPHSGLDDPYSLTPNAHPDSTTTYILSVGCTTCEVPCLSEMIDSMTVYVQDTLPLPTSPFHVPTLFTTDQTFLLDSLQPNTRVKLYDMRGRQLYSNENYDNDFTFINMSQGIYSYQIELSDNRIITGKFGVVQR